MKTAILVVSLLANLAWASYALLFASPDRALLGETAIDIAPRPVASSDVNTAELQRVLRDVGLADSLVKSILLAYLETDRKPGAVHDTGNRKIRCPACKWTPRRADRW